MSRGGARNRSGPQPDPTSERSERRGYKLTALPSEGYSGSVPAWPLNGQTDREAELWEWAWSTPQACAWSQEPWRWHSVGMWVRVAAICEGQDATAADKSGLHRFADQIGLTPAGLRENGWAIAQDEVAPKREKPAERPKPQRRLRAVDAQ
jgi:hypothetical protein